MRKLILIGAIGIILFSCTKELIEKTTEEKLIGIWIFKEQPKRLLNSWEGRCCEDRTIFSGQERLSFSENGDFKVDSITYGCWELDSFSNILIDMTSTGGYAVGNFHQPKIQLSIIEINDTLLKVDHSFYRFYPNYYILEPEK